MKASKTKTLLLCAMSAMYLCRNIAVGQPAVISELEKKAFGSRQAAMQSSASDWFDVTYYKLDLNITAQPGYVKGYVTIIGICTQNNAGSLALDLASTMFVDSIFVNGTRTIFVQSISAFEIALDRPYQNGEVITVDVYYQGTPVPTGFGSFVFNNHNGVPWIFSLSEPYGASDWWPCKNSPDDKADSADIIVTCDSLYKVGSQGILVSSVNHGNGTTTYHWKERYPIASYLISIAMTDYVQFSDWFRYSPADSMEVLNYVLPEHYAEALESLPKAVDMLSIFSDLFGLYPFIKEKYGHAEFTGGGMEHQTMTSIGRFDEYIVAHELAHQWFGDMITCRTWSDLWLNEGFAEYSTALYFERKYGAGSYRDYMTSLMEFASSAQGVMGAPDLTNAGTLFNFRLVYAKGGSVLHMLRRVLGDTLFFRAMYEYANDPALKYSTASTQDFQSVCERVSNMDLEYFFQEWVYGEGYPTYEFSWEWRVAGDSPKLIILLRQPAVRTNPVFFSMPLDLRITGPALDTTVTVFNNAREQSFTLNIRTRPDAVMLDPEGWVLKRVLAGGSLPAEYRLEQNYPNPFNGSTTLLYHLPHREHVTLKVYDLLGREVERLVDAQQQAGTYEVPWSSQNISSGVYFYRLIAGDVHLQKKMVVIR